MHTDDANGLFSFPSKWAILRRTIEQFDIFQLFLIRPQNN